MKSAKMDHDKSFEGCGRRARTKYPKYDIWNLRLDRATPSGMLGYFSGPLWTKVGLRELSNLFHFKPVCLCQVFSIHSEFRDPNCSCSRLSFSKCYWVEANLILNGSSNNAFRWLDSKLIGFKLHCLALLGCQHKWLNLEEASPSSYTTKAMG